MQASSVASAIGILGKKISDEITRETGASMRYLDDVNRRLPVPKWWRGPGIYDETDCLRIGCKLVLEPDTFGNITTLYMGNIYTCQVDLSNGMYIAAKITRIHRHNGKCDICDIRYVSSEDEMYREFTSWLAGTAELNCGLYSYYASIEEFLTHDFGGEDGTKYWKGPGYYDESYNPIFEYSSDGTTLHSSASIGDYEYMVEPEKYDPYIAVRGITEMVRMIHDNAKNKGFHTEKEQWVLQEAVMLALIGTEVSEAIEAHRVGDMENLEEELADIVIRVFDFCGLNDIDIEKAIKNKMTKNLGRPIMHGGKRY